MEVVATARVRRGRAGLGHGLGEQEFALSGGLNGYV